MHCRRTRLPRAELHRSSGAKRRRLRMTRLTTIVKLKNALKPSVLRSTQPARKKSHPVKIVRLASPDKKVVFVLAQNCVQEQA
jgi:hypothetical protein